MSGWLYLIKNGDLYKIGITKHFDIRMHRLKPDKVISKIFTRDYKKLERKFHKRYKKERIPQTEYFRLDNNQLKDITNEFWLFTFRNDLLCNNFIQVITFLFFYFLGLLFIFSLGSNDYEFVIYNSLIWLKRLSICFSLTSIFSNSGKSLSLLQEFIYRIIRSLIFILFLYLFMIATGIFYFK